MSIRHESRTRVAEITEVIATDARKRFQFETSVAPDVSKELSPRCFGHIDRHGPRSV